MLCKAGINVECCMVYCVGTGMSCVIVENSQLAKTSSKTKTVARCSLLVPHALRVAPGGGLFSLLMGVINLSCVFHSESHNPFVILASTTYYCTYYWTLTAPSPPRTAHRCKNAADPAWHRCWWYPVALSARDRLITLPVHTTGCT